jgi:flagellar biosynthetic protein FlhB
MPDYTGDKSLDPTPHRRQQARREGHLAKSHDLAAAVLLLAGLGAVLMLGGGLVAFLADYCRAQLGGEPWLTADATGVASHWNATLWALGRRLLPLLGLICLAGAGINVLQTGFLFLPDRLALDFTRLDPLQGLRRVFSAAGVVRLGFGLFKLAIAMAVAGVALYGQRAAILGLCALAPPALALQMAQILLWTALKVAGALFVLSLLDYGYQWWRNEQDLKMTPQELREEMRNLEGNPQVIARRKQVGRDLVLQRISALVSEANVVLTNPSQLAIALRYDPATMAAPIVVAKGAGVWAEHIRRAAAEAGVPTLERKRLARALYRRVDPQQAIPADQFAAVAEAFTQTGRRAGTPHAATTARH